MSKPNPQSSSSGLSRGSMRVLNMAWIPATGARMTPRNRYYPLASWPGSTRPSNPVVVHDTALSVPVWVLGSSPRVTNGEGMQNV